ncbi:hexosaminidase D-like [Pectinophora gossypiella]|uniref:hexosaminidase D-like n=1 Tax=Pectinophora gossypiella TaxID=13191 RepID=UPI00214E763A|nr:hexosaminidase D-like [Pectinophora gossypiella]
MLRLLRKVKKMRSLLSPLSRKTKMFMYLLLLILGTYLINIFILYEMNFVAHKERNMLVKQEYVLVHIDLKGAPPTTKYLTSMLSKLKTLGANGLLMEYEDMFPYKGRIANLSTPHRYDEEPLKKFLTTATKMDIEIIPLVQTFGHMEHVLKLEEYETYREMLMHPDVICPSKNESLDLIREMLRQVITFHESVAPLKHIHIGCDEVYDINFCHRCKARKQDDMDIYLRHVKNVRDIVRSLTPTTTVLIWDDMLRKIRPGMWQFYEHFDNIEPVVWDYKAHITISHLSLRFYHDHFSHTWIATAFKGADGVETVLPDIRKRLSNILSWMYFIQGYKFGGESETHNFKGIVLTGWARYSHFEPLCELLPVSMPSLIMQLLVVKRFNKGIPASSLDEDWSVFFWKHLLEDFYTALECNDDLRIHIDSFNGCKFNGTFPLYNIIRNYTTFVDRMLNKFKDNDFDLYMQYGNIHMRKTLEFLSDSEGIYGSLRYLEVVSKKAMQRYFSANVYKEYIGYKSYRLYKLLHQCAMKAKSVVDLRRWGRGRKIPEFPFFQPPYVTSLTTKDLKKLSTKSVSTYNTRTLGPGIFG